MATTTKNDKIKEKTRSILTDVSGYIGTRVLNIGLDMGIFEELAVQKDGISTDKLASNLGFDRKYLKVWLDAAFGYGFIQLEDSKYMIQDEVEELLLNEEFPGYIGGLPNVFRQTEMFDNFREHLVSGKRIWWNDTSPEWIAAVSKTAKPMYNRMLAQGFDRIPNFKEKMEHGTTLELACGAGYGLIKISNRFPSTQITGLDGDEYSLKVSRQNLEARGLDERVKLQHSAFEELSAEEEYDIIFINASMHECRDIEKVVSNVFNALKSNGIFVISDFPFPESKEEYSKLPNKIMLGINFFESQIDDLLLPTSTYIDLLSRQGFRSPNSFNLTPTHSVIYGYKP